MHTAPVPGLYDADTYRHTPGPLDWDGEGGCRAAAGDGAPPADRLGGGSMRAPSLLLFVVVVLGLGAGGPAVAQSVRDRPVQAVTAAVQVTTNPSGVRAHSSPQIAVNPTSGELVVVESDPRAPAQQRACNAHISTDDGRTWFPGGTMMLEPFTDCSLHGEYGPYASLGFASDGTLYVAFVANDIHQSDPHGLVGSSAPARRPCRIATAGAAPGGIVGPDCGAGPQAVPAAHPPRRTPRHVFLARSDDGGRSFETTFVFQGPEEAVKAPERLANEGINKGPMLAVDPTDPDRVYVGWRQGDLREDQGKLGSLVAASSDGGRTFGEPVDLSDERGGDYPSLAVDRDGTVHAVYWTRTFGAPDGTDPVRPIYHMRSTDGGATFGERTEIDPGNQNTQRPPLVVADPGSSSVYVAWAAHPDPDNAADDYTGDLDVFVVASHNSGEDWEARVAVNDDDGGADQHLPGLAVAPDGRVGVAWYDDRHDPAGEASYLQDVYYSYSTDGGRTWSPDVRITDRSIDRTIGVWDNNISSNHNVGIASTASAAYIAWQDSRNANPVTQPEDVYMAKAVLSGPTTPVAGGSATPAMVWLGAGAGGALLVAGLVLVAASRRRPRPGRAVAGR